MADSVPQVHSELSRDLNLFHVTMMGLGMMIGAGVFLGVGTSIQESGAGGVLLTFALNGLIAMFTAMSYAELSSAIPRAGGAYNFARIAFGKAPSFMAGWMEWFASSVAGSLYAVTFALYTTRYLNTIGALDWLYPMLPWDRAAATPIVVKGVTLIVGVFFIYINCRGASETGKVGAFFTLGQTLFMVVIGVMGFVVVARDPGRLANFKPFLPHGWGALLITMGFTSVAFEGYEVIAQAGDETINPKKNLPKAMLYSVFIVTLTYVADAFATVVSIKKGAIIDGAVIDHPWQWIGGHGPMGFGEAVSRLMPMANLLLTLAVIFASTSALNATIYSATRACYALGRDRMLPRVIAGVSKKRRTPWAALAATGVIVLVVSTCLPTKHVASSASIMFLLLFLLVNLCVIKIRRHMGDELSYGFLMPFFPLFPVLAILSQAALVTHLHHMSFIAVIVGPSWIVLGGIVYALYSRSRALTAEHDVQVLEETPAPEAAGTRIMVAVANPETALSMVRNTYRICEAKQGTIELLHMVPVPQHVPLSDAEEYMMEGKEGIVETMLYLAPMFPVSTTIRYCRSVARGILSAVREKRAQMLILGWRGQARHDIYSMGSTVDPIIERSPCDTLIFKDCGGEQRFRRVLVPVAGGPHGALALEVASMLAQPEDGEVTVFTAGRRRGFDLGRFIDANRDRLHLPLERVRMKIGARPQAVPAILEEAEAHDLVVIGCTGRSTLARMGRLPVPETVARRCGRPLVMVKSGGGVQSWVNRWI